MPPRLHSKMFGEILNYFITMPCMAQIYSFKRMFRKLLIIAALFIVTCLSVSKSKLKGEDIGCLSPSGQVVDWWVVYQIPGAKKIPRFYYYDITHGDKGKFTLINQSVDDTDQPLKRTVHQLNVKQLQTLVWNDQIDKDEKPEDNLELEEAELQIPPCSVETDVQGYNRAFGTHSHSKFFMGIKRDQSAGFGVVHSFPHFPKYSPESGRIEEEVGYSQKYYGQHAFCFTLRGVESIKKFVDNTCTINPEIYYDTMPVILDTDTEKAQYRKFFKADDVTECALNNQTNYFQRCEVEDISKEAFITEKYSLGLEDLEVHYKNGFRQDQPAEMFEHLVSEFRSDILLQTWGRPRPFPDSTYQVEDQSYSVRTKGRLMCEECQTSRGSKTWCGSMDHSKWLVTDSEGQHISCFGDLNRNTQAQLKRGGAFYCLDHSGLHTALKRMITSTPCDTQAEGPDSSSE